MSVVFLRDVANKSLKVELGFGVDLTTDPSTWSLTDVSSDVQYATAIVTTKGRLDEQTQVTSAQCDFTLLNDTLHGNGNYTVRRATSIYYPNVHVGIPCRVTLTISGTTTEQFSGFVSAMPAQYDETGRAATVTITANGVLATKNQGSPPKRSALYRQIVRSNPTAYWSLEDGAASSTGALTAGAGTAFRTVSGRPNPVFGYRGIGGTAALADLSNGSTLVASPTYSPTSPGGKPQFTLAVAFELVGNNEANPGSAGLSQRVLPCLFTTTGGLVFWFETSTYQVFPGGAQNSVQMTVWSPLNPAGGVILAAAGDPSYVEGNLKWFVFQAIESGGNTFSGQQYDLGGFAACTLNTPDQPGVSIGKIDKIYLNPTQLLTNQLSQFQVYPTGSITLAQNVRVAHVALWDGTLRPFQDMGGPPSGWLGEPALDRYRRLSAEEGVPFQVDGISSDRPMGAQLADTWPNLVQQTADVDGGVLEDGVGFGTVLHAFENRLNRAADITLAHTLLQVPFVPTEDNQKVRNTVTASRLNGGSVTITQTPGQPYDVASAGEYDATTPPTGTLNVQADPQLTGYAGWAVNLGTVDADRYGNLTLQLARTGLASLVDDFAAITNGDRVTVTGNYALAGPPADVMVEGWRSSLTQVTWELVLNASPAAPYAVAVVNTARVASGQSTVQTLLTNVGTSLKVTPGASVWSTSAGDYPQDLNVGGEQITVTTPSLSAGVYTFPITARGVNGVQVAHAVGQDVDVWNLPRVAFGFPFATLVNDPFQRTVANGWGTAPVGGLWTTAGGSAGDFAVATGAASMSHPAVSVARSASLPVSLTDCIVETEVWLSKDVTAGSFGVDASTVQTDLMLRWVDASNHYLCGLQWAPGGGLNVRIAKNVAGTVTVLAGGQAGVGGIDGFNINNGFPVWYAGEVYRLKAMVHGSQLFVKAWNKGAAEPEWLTSVTDTTYASAGRVGVRSILGANVTSTATVADFDNFRTSTL